MLDKKGSRRTCIRAAGEAQESPEAGNDVSSGDSVMEGGLEHWPSDSQCSALCEQQARISVC